MTELPGFLPDHELLRIGPSLMADGGFNPSSVQPASIEVHLASRLLLPVRREGAIDIRTEGNPSRFYVPASMTKLGYTLEPGRWLLGATDEHFNLDDNILVRLEGVSTLARYGLVIHQTAGFVDPGFDGRITLEIRNNGDNAFVLFPGLRIGQVSVYRLASSAALPYGAVGARNHYQHQSGPTPPAARKDG